MCSVYQLSNKFTTHSSLLTIKHIVQADLPARAPPLSGRIGYSDIIVLPPRTVIPHGDAESIVGRFHFLYEMRLRILPIAIWTMTVFWFVTLFEIHRTFSTSQLAGEIADLVRNDVDHESGQAKTKNGGRWTENGGRFILTFREPQ